MTELQKNKILKESNNPSAGANFFKFDADWYVRIDSIIYKIVICIGGIQKLNQLDKSVIARFVKQRRAEMAGIIYVDENYSHLDMEEFSLLK